MTQQRLDVLMLRLIDIRKKLKTERGGSCKGYKDAQKINELLRMEKNTLININQVKQALMNVATF